MKFRKLTLVFLAVLLSVSVVWAAGDIKIKAGSRTQIMGSGNAYAQFGGNKGENFTSIVSVMASDYEGVQIEVNVYQSAGQNDDTGVSVYCLTESPTTSGISTLAIPSISVELATDTATVNSGVTHVFTITNSAYVVLGISNKNAGDTTHCRVYYYPWYWQYTDNWMIWGA